MQIQNMLINSSAILLWLTSFTLFFYGILQLKPIWLSLNEAWGMGKKIRYFQRAGRIVFQLQEILASGLVPEPEDWNRMRDLPEPWNEITQKSVQELRDQGAPLLPTLKRIRTALEEQVELMQESQAKSSQAWSQAILGVVLVPLFAFILYALLPGVQQSMRVYVPCVVFSLLLSGSSVIWISVVIDQARFGGVKREHQGWYASTLAGMERLWAFISTGLPPDLAWKAMMEELVQNDSALAKEWGSTVWSKETDASSRYQNEFERLILNVGIEIKKSIQVSLVEGRGCLERMESIHRAFLTEYRLKLIRQLNLLPNHCLKPLFILLMPAVFLLLFVGLALSVGNLS